MRSLCPYLPLAAQKMTSIRHSHTPHAGFRANSAATRTELHNELHLTYSEFTTVSAMSRIENSPGLVEIENYIRREWLAF